MNVKPVCFVTVLIVDITGMSKESIILAQTSCFLLCGTGQNKSQVSSSIELRECKATVS